MTQPQQKPSTLALVAQLLSAAGMALIWLFVLLVVGFVVYALH